MDCNRIDDCGCCKPCRIPLAKAQISTKKNMSSKEKNQRRKPPFNLHNLHNFKIIPRTPARRENCRGVGKRPSEDCDCLQIFDSDANVSKQDDNIISNGYQDESSIHGNEEEVNEYLNKLMTTPKENYKVYKSIDIHKFDCCKEGGQKTWLEYPPENYSSASMKQVIEQLMNAQYKDPHLIKNTNYDQTIILPCRDPKMIDVHGHALNSTNSLNLITPKKSERNLNQNSSENHKCNNLQKKSLLLPNTTEIFQHNASNDTFFSKESQCFECPIQSLTFSNKNCRWGGCHGPMKTKCLDDPDKGHMFMNGCQVWHCGGCCKMERDHAAYESMALLQQSDRALELNKLQNELLQQGE